jgi:hypothetical protein
MKDFIKFKRLLFLVAFFAIEAKLMAQDYECINNVNVYYLNNCKENNENDRINSMSISFENGFYEEIEVYFNNSLIYKKTVEPNELTGYTDASMRVQFKEKMKSSTLKIKLIKSKTAVSFFLDNRYKYLSINLLAGNKWSMSYSNSQVLTE